MTSHPERVEIQQRQDERRTDVAAFHVRNTVWCCSSVAEECFDDCETLLSLITASEKRAETARDDALEEAAKEAEKFDRRGAEQRIAQAIRALKGQR